MTTIIVASNPGSGSNTGIARSLNQAATVGNTLIAWLHHTASTTDTMTGAIDNASNAFTQDYLAVDSFASDGIRVYRRSNIGNAATSFTPQAASATGVYGGMVEVSGMDNAAPYVGTTYLTEAATLSHSFTFTTTTPNAIVIVGIRSASSLNTLSGFTGGWTDVGLTRTGAAMLYNADCGAAGSKTVTFTSASGPSVHYYITEYKAAVTDPTVSTVSNETTVEGGTNTHTVTLSGPTNRPNTPISIALAGVTATGGGVDFTSALASLTFGSSDVTFDGTQLLVPNAVTTFPIVVTTVDDLLNEAAETYTLTVGGTAGTGTITDNDAPPVVTFSDGVESFGAVTCVATLGAVSGKDVSFQVDTTNGTKTAGTNYTAIVAQTVTIPAGSLTAAITANTL